MSTTPVAAPVAAPAKSTGQRALKCLCCVAIVILVILALAAIGWLIARAALPKTAVGGACGSTNRLVSELVCASGSCGYAATATGKATTTTCCADDGALAPGELCGNVQPSYYCVTSAQCAGTPAYQCVTAPGQPVGTCQPVTSA